MKRAVILCIIFKTLLLNGQAWRFVDLRLGSNIALKLVESYDKGVLFPVSDNIIYRDIFLYKLDINGDLKWKRNYKYQNTNAYFETTSIIELKSGGYLI